jgi:uncharacterized protein (TIGR03067 family)
MKRLAIAFFLLALAAGWAAAQGDPSKEDLKKMQGKWEAVSLIDDGEAKKLDEKSYRIVSGNKVIDPAFNIEDEIRLDATKRPKELDIHINRKGVAPYALKAIYELEGDTLRVCVDLESKARPTAFQSKPGSGHRLVTLKRVKE